MHEIFRPLPEFTGIPLCRHKLITKGVVRESGAICPVNLMPLNVPFIIKLNSAPRNGWSHHRHIILFVIQREGRRDKVNETPFGGHAPKDEKWIYSLLSHRGGWGCCIPRKLDRRRLIEDTGGVMAIDSSLGSAFLIPN